MKRNIKFSNLLIPNDCLEPNVSVTFVIPNDPVDLKLELILPEAVILVATTLL